MQTSLDQSLNMIINTNHLLGQLIRILYEKSKRSKSYKVNLHENESNKLIIFSFAFRITIKVVYC